MICGHLKTAQSILTKDYLLRILGEIGVDEFRLLEDYDLHKLTVVLPLKRKDKIKQTKSALLENIPAIYAIKVKLEEA